MTFLKERTGIPVLGVIPYLNKLGIDDEDSVSLQEIPDDHGHPGYFDAEKFSRALAKVLNFCKSFFGF